MEGFHSEGCEVYSTGDITREVIGLESKEDCISVQIDYYEELELLGATSVANFKNKNLPAITLNTYGKGKAYYMALESNHIALEWLIHMLSDELGLTQDISVPSGVQVRKISDNKRFFVNTTSNDVIIKTYFKGKGVLRNSMITDEFLLKGYDAELIILEEDAII